MKSAVFLDRDGTINEDAGYICTLDELKFIPRAFDAMRMLQEKHDLFIVTNQSGVARGFFTEEDLVKFQNEFDKILKDEGINIKKTYYCPHLKEDGCKCYKPSTFFMNEAEKEFNIDLNKSFVIGDHPHDIEMAHEAGASSVYLLTGHGQKHKPELEDIKQPNLIADSIYEAAVWIAKEN